MDMKSILLFALSAIFLCIHLSGKTITGKLIDQNNNGLSGLQLKLYINPNVYTATSGSDGSFTFNNVTKVKEEKLPTGYSVSANYPNPFNPKTRILISMPNSVNVRIDVYNILGQKVMDQIKKYFNAGNSFIDLELNGLSNGFYIARITLDEKFTVTRKLLLIYGSQHLSTSNSTTSFSLQKSTMDQQSHLTVNIDSLVITGSSIKKNTFTNLPVYTGSDLDLGSFTVNTQSTGTPCPGIPTLTDTRDGKVYNTVQIDTQCWLKENINVGTIMIKGSQDQTNKGIIEKYCYGDDLNNCATYGGLYQWAEAVQYQNGATNSTSASPALTGNIQGICSIAWHIPSKAEFQTLESSVKVNNNSNTLKAIGQGYGSGVGTNTSGFSALLAGTRNTNGGHYYGDFDDLSGTAGFWGSTESSSDNANGMSINDNGSVITFYDGSKTPGFSVRCCKD